jgi:hypothetical protein
MIELGLRLALRSGREALIRLALIAAAVMVGVAVLLSALSEFHAFNAAGARPCWECTSGSSVTAKAYGEDPKAELWNYSEDYYEGRTIKRLDVAAFGPQAPVIPGMSRLPGAGQYYVSPALASLLGSVPRDELGARFPGAQAGVIGDAALTGPDELVIVIGYSPAQMALLPATVQVDAISTAPEINSIKSVYQFGFGIAAIGLVFPIVILIGTATRLAAARREERFAAFRLVGATPRQMSALASVDALAGAAVGTLAGIGLFLLVRSWVAGAAVTGTHYFPALVTPTGTGYLAALVGVPAVSALAALWSLRRARISPLGVSRKVTPPPPGILRIVPLALGLGLFIVPLAVSNSSNPDFKFANLGLLLIMVGLVVGGPWLTMQAARLVARYARGASALLAARRLADDPRAAFRSVSGLVLALFVGTAIAVLAPSLVSTQQAVGGGTLGNVLRASFQSGDSACADDCGTAPGRSAGDQPKQQAAQMPGLTPQTGADVLNRLNSYQGVTVLPLYVPTAQDEQSAAAGQGGGRCAAGAPCPQGPDNGPRAIVSCASLARFSAFGACPAGATEVAADGFQSVLDTDNVLAVERDLPVVDRTSTSVTDNLASLNLGAVLVQVSDPATLERIRTLLSSYTAGAGAAGAPQTFGEVAQARAALTDDIVHVALAMVVLTLLVAGCSLAVAVGGGLVERKRPITLLRLTGTPTPALFRMVLLESVLPLVLAAVLAAGAGFAVAVPVVGQVAAKGASVALPGTGYLLATGGGLLASLLVIAAALPLLSRITRPDGVRFE